MNNTAAPEFVHCPVCGQLIKNRANYLTPHQKLERMLSQHNGFIHEWLRKSPEDIEGALAYAYERTLHPEWWREDEPYGGPMP